MSCPATQRTFYKDLQQLHRTVESSTDGQAEIIGMDDMTVRIALKPKTGYNAHAVFTMTIQCSGTYPRMAPKVNFNSPIFHPNIDAKMGYICLSLLNEWHSCWSLLDIVKAVLFLIENPNYESANNGYANAVDTSDLEVKTKRLLAGLKVNGHIFPPNEAWCEWARETNCFPTDEDEEDEGNKSESQIPSNSTVIELDTSKEADIPPLLLSDAFFEEINQETTEDYSIMSSETAPSCAKFRYSMEPDERSLERFPIMHTGFESASQRVTIWTPSSNRGLHKADTFYFFEILCDSHHIDELGPEYNSLYIGNKLRDNQMDPDSHQTSCSCGWYPVYNNNIDYSYNEYTPYESSLELNQLFKLPETPVRNGLASDFCPWSLEDGLGSSNILGGLFFEGKQRGANFECFPFESESSCTDSDGFRRLFNATNLARRENNELESDVISGGEDDDNDIDADETVVLSVSIGTDTDEVSRVEEELDKDENLENPPFKMYAGSFYSFSTETYFESDEDDILMHECRYCNGHDRYIAETINSNVYPQFIWLFRRTRWSIRFAVQQTVTLSMQGIKIPPWRVSTARLLSDVCRYCKAHKEAINLVLLDPMALSPLSPVLNLMRHVKGTPSQLNGVLWMTAFDALSPSFHVPLPKMEPNEIAHPSPFSLRMLALGALTMNWVSWLSRTEYSATLGISRPSPIFLDKSIAACILQPLSLGCGQSASLDLWPLWFLRGFLKSLLCLSRLSWLSPHNGDLNYMLPFSDLDEI